VSGISRIYSSYSEALGFSRERFGKLYAGRARNATDFYEAFFRNLVRPFSEDFTNPATRRWLHSHMERFFGTRRLDFVAIDGSCAKDTFQDFVVFSACAYGAKGQVNLEDDPPQVRYEKWTIDKDVSMVTYVPVPYSEFADVMEADAKETFLVSDDERVDMSRIDTRMMELAEVYLAYSVASSSSMDAPKIIMLDRSPSSMLADLALQPEAVPMLDYPFDRRRLTVEDVTIALAHPFNRALGVPTLKRFRQYTAVIAEMHHRRSSEVNLDELAAENGLTSADLDGALRYLTQARDHDGNLIAPLARKEERGGATWVATDEDPVASWEYCVALFESICKRVFVEKDQRALVYEVADGDGTVRERWMSPDDVRFLIAVGVRALIEKCWESNILLTGIIKDSASQYLTRNYLGVMKYLGDSGYPELENLDVYQLPWTDRAFMELLPLADDALGPPWASVEFDSAYMTLHAEEGPGKEPIIAGVRQIIVAPERLFLRSLAQFFVKRDKATPLMGHVVFVDRLAYPGWDDESMEQVTLETKALGRVRPACYRDREQLNVGQMLNMYLLDVLTCNHFPEVIGYPDPLHKADWGAKSVGRRMRSIVESSAITFRSQPLSRTFRDIREAFHRK
jgi:hypothetical protein